MHNRDRGPKPQKIYKKKELLAGPPAPPKPIIRLDPNEDWLTLLTAGLDEVRAVWSSKEDTQERTVLLVLETIGLLQFLTDVWCWQEVDVCQAFVLHWDHKSKTTKVLGVHIDVGYRNFLVMTGLGRIHIDQVESSTRAMHGDDKKGKKKRGVDFIEDMESKSISFLLLNNPIIESLLLLLNLTLWFTKMQAHCPTKEMVYLLIESMRGKMVDWCKSVYERFISEVRELQDRHDNDPNEKLQTLAGPFMCFLYSRAKCKAEAMKENISVRGKRDDKHFRSTQKDCVRGVLKEKNRFYYDDGEVVPPGFRSENLRLPFPPSRMPRKRWYESFEQSRTVMNLIPQPKLPSKTHEEIHSELEEKFSKTIASEGYQEYQVSEETMTTLTKTFEEQKERQERFKNHLRSSWLQPSSTCSFGCCPYLAS